MDERLAAVIRAREGVVSASDAARIGVTPVQLDGLTRSGELVRLRRGAYALRQPYQAASPEERYRLRTKAILRTRPPVDAASHHAAVLLHGVDTLVSISGWSTSCHGSTRLACGAGCAPIPGSA